MRFDSNEPTALRRRARALLTFGAATLVTLAAIGGQAQAQDEPAPAEEPAAEEPAGDDGAAEDSGDQEAAEEPAEEPAEEATEEATEEPAEDEVAEEEMAEEPAGDDTAAVDSASDTGATPEGGGPPEAGDPIGLQYSTYWGGKRDVAVVQKRLFRKDGKLEFTAFGGVIPNDPFLTYIPVGVRFNYYFIESISVEVAGAFTGGAVQVESDLAGFLKNNPNVQANVDLLDKQIWRANAAVVWSPFYGKMALVNANLSHFDINLVAGLGVVQTESPTTDRSDVESEIKPEGTLGAGLRFFLTDYMTLRMDYRQGIFEKIGGGVSTPSELTLGLSFFLGG